VTPREREVLALVATGHTTAGIARRLAITSHTVESHVRSARTKLGVATRTAAAARAASPAIGVALPAAVGAGVTAPTTAPVPGPAGVAACPSSPSAGPRPAGRQGPRPRPGVPPLRLVRGAAPAADVGAPAGGPAGLDRSTTALLGALARGCFVAEAAREAHVSLRTAHRRLHAARRTLGAATTAEAVALWARHRAAADDPGAAGPVVPDHESAVRRLAADAAGLAYRAVRTLGEAREVGDGVVVIEGDLGGQVFVVVPARLVRCDETALRRLARDLGARLRTSADTEVDVYFERHPTGARIAGGAGGGVVLTRAWAHDELVQAGLEPAIVDVLTARRPHLDAPPSTRD
jgi:DNA-binding CsgD family transcriptional regulator